MAGQDFAHNAAPSKNVAAGGATSALPVVAIIIVAGACFAAGYWLGAADIQQTGNRIDVDAIEAQLAVKDAEAKMQQARVETLEALVEQWKNKAGQGAHTKVGELNFYKSLPKQSVTPAPVSAKADKPTPKQVVKRPDQSVRVQQPLNSEHAKKAIDRSAYRIQIASFRKHNDAAPILLKLSKAGFPAFVEKVNLGDKGLWFRVYAGPFASKSMAESNQQKIEQKVNIKGLLVRGS